MLGRTNVGGALMKVLFFDVGYTLVDESTVWDRRCKEQAATEEAKRLGLTAADIYHEVEKASMAGLPQFRTVIDKYHFKEAAPYRHELETLYEDATKVLKTLAGRYELGVIANQSDGLEKRLEEFGIRQYLIYVVSSWDVQMMKPDVRIFEHALKLAKCQPEEACMIGDRIDNDVIPAKAIGMKTIWVKQGFGGLQEALARENASDYEVDSLSELLRIL